MAGMYSWLHKSQLRLEANASAASTEDGNNEFRSIPVSRSPMPGQRFLGLGHVHMKTMTGQSDRLPKRFRKRRCHEIHPVLRRSVCTLLLAFLGVISGFVIIVIDHYQFHKFSTTGLIILLTAVGFCIVGIAWFCYSLAQLKKFKKRTQEIKSERENSQEKISESNMYSWNQQVACDPAALSASKWPVRRPDDEAKAEFRYKVTPSDDRSANYSSPVVQGILPEVRWDSGSSTSMGSGDDNPFSREPFAAKSRTHTPTQAMISRGASPDHSAAGIGAAKEAAAAAERAVLPELFVTNHNHAQLETEEIKSEGNKN